MNNGIKVIVSRLEVNTWPLRRASCVVNSDLGQIVCVFFLHRLHNYNEERLWKWNCTNGHQHTIMCHHLSRRWLVACPVPNHHLKQYWHIVNWTLGNKLPWNSRAISSWPQWIVPTSGTSKLHNFLFPPFIDNFFRIWIWIWLTLISPWISYHMPNQVWDEITYQLPHLIMEMIIHLFWNSLTSTPKIAWCPFSGTLWTHESTQVLWCSWVLGQGSTEGTISEK